MPPRRPADFPKHHHAEARRIDFRPREGRLIPVTVFTHRELAIGALAREKADPSQSDHIQTTHIGSLPRPHALLDLMKAKFTGQPYDQKVYDETVKKAVAEVVRKQVECGIDIVTDGEFSKPGFFTYIRERIEGFEARPGQKLLLFQQEVAAFPEYYAQYFKEAMMGGTVVPIVPVVCTGPVRYRGEKFLQIDIDNVKAAAKAAGVPDQQVFLPATAPSGVGINEYYKSDEEYFHALAAELNKEYRAIVAAGLLVQVDDPFLPDIFVDPRLDKAQMRRRAEIYVEAANAALASIPPESVRFHTCYGINEGPRIYEAALADIIEYVLKIKAGSYSFEGRQPAPRARVSSVRAGQGAGRQGAVPGRHHPCQQHRRASGADRRAAHALRQAGRPRERDGRRRLRLLLAGAVPDRGASDGGVGEVQGDARGSGHRHQAALGQAQDQGQSLAARSGEVPERKKGAHGEISGEEEMTTRKNLQAYAALSFAVILAAPALAADKITFGFMSVLSGPNAIIGTELRDGMLLGLDHVGGKVGGLTTRVIVEDDQQKADVARQIADKFVKAEKVDATIGFSLSSLMLAVYGPLIESKTITISSNPGPSQIAGKECSPYFFSTSWQGDNWAEAMGGYLQKKGQQNVYLMAPNYAAGKDVLTGFKRFYKGSIAGEVYTPFTQLDFAAELSQIKATNPSAVYAFYPGGLGVQFVKQYSQAGLKDKYTLYTSYTVDNMTLGAIGDDAVGLVITTSWALDLDNPTNKKFVSGFQAKYGRSPAEYAVHAYDTIMLLDSAVRAVNGKIEDKPAFMAALKKADFKSPRGSFRFNTNQFPIQDFFQARVMKDASGKPRIKIEDVALQNYGDAYAAECPMK